LFSFWWVGFYNICTHSCISTYISAEILPHLLLQPEKQMSIGSGHHLFKAEILT
jgi:hypothetical protein